MATLVDHGKCGGIHSGFVMSGNAHIPVMQVRGKRMGTDRKDSTGKIKAHILCQIFCQLPLLLLRIVSIQEVILNADRAFHHLL